MGFVLSQGKLPKAEQKTQAEIARIFGVSEMTISRYANRKRSAERAGKRGRTPLLSDDILDMIFMEAGKMATQGRGWTRLQFAEVVQGIRRDVFGQEAVLPSKSWIRNQRIRFEERCGKKTRMQVPRTKDMSKAMASKPEVVKAYFSMLADVFKEYEWEGCSKGMPTCPADRIVVWDEVGCKYQTEAGQKVLVLDQNRAESLSKASSDTIGHFTIMLGFSLDGTTVPSFCVFKGKVWRTKFGRLKGLPSEWTFTESESGSMTSCQVINQPKGPKVVKGTMMLWAEHVERNVRSWQSAMEGEPMLHIIDQCTVHNDPYAGEYLQKNGHILIGAPKGSTHYLQVGGSICCN